MNKYLLVFELLLLYSQCVYSQTTSAGDNVTQFTSQQTVQQTLPKPTITLTTTSIVLSQQSGLIHTANTSYGIMQTATYTQTPENHINGTSVPTGPTEVLPMPFFNQEIWGLFVALMGIGGGGLLLICLTATCFCIFRAKRNKKRNRKFTLKMRSETQTSTSVMLEPITSPNKVKTDQVSETAENNINTFQTSDNSQVKMHAASNEYFIKTRAVPPPVVPTMPTPVPVDITDTAELEEIYDNNPLTPSSDTEDSIYDNEIIFTSGSEDSIYDNDVVLRKSDSDNDEDSIYDNDVVLRKSDSDNDEENIYDNDVIDGENDTFVNTTTVIANSNAEDVSDKLYYETVDQWIPQISKVKKKRNNRPPPILIEGAGQLNSSPPLEDDEGYIDVTPLQQTTLVKNTSEDIYDN